MDTLAVFDQIDAIREMGFAESSGERMPGATAISAPINKYFCPLALSFMEINTYTGLLLIENYYESSLHFEESLIKYKTNTMKWKSNHSRKI